MTHSKLSIALLVLLSPVVAFAHGGGGGMGGGPAGHGMGGGPPMGMEHGTPNVTGGMRPEAPMSHAINATTHVNNDAHGDAVSAAAKAARLDHDGDKVGADVRVVAHDRTLGKATHAGQMTRVRTHHKIHAKPMDNDAHGDAVSAAAKAAKLDKDGDKTGVDVRAVARTKTRTKHHK